MQPSAFSMPGAVCALATALTTTVSAETVLLSQPPDGMNATSADLNAGVPFEIVDNVQFMEDIELVSLRWWGVYEFADTPPQADADAFVFRLYADVAGKPADGALVSVPLSQVVRTSTGRMFGNNIEYEYDATLPAPVPLSADTTYWIGVINDTSADLDDNWYWEHSLLGDGTRYGRSLSPLGPWGPGNANLAFELIGGPPAPACPTDLNGDNITDGIDLAAVLAAWGSCEAPPSESQE